MVRIRKQRIIDVVGLAVRFTGTFGGIDAEVGFTRPLATRQLCLQYAVTDSNAYIVVERKCLPDPLEGERAV